MIKSFSAIRLFVAGVMLVVVHAGLITLAGAQDDAATTQSGDRTVITQIDGPENVAVDGIRFEAIDVFIDSGSVSLAAWQFELQSETPGVEIVGIEGGDHAAFAEPPYYDPQAMNNNRVILAAFSTARDLPSGRSRVARVHVQLEGRGLKEYRTKLAVSATSDGTEIPATILITRSGG